MSHPHRRPSDYSRGSSPRVERTLSVTEASFQSLGLHETAGAQHLSVPSSYGPPSSRHRRPSYPRGQLDPNFVQPQYESYPRNASPASFSSLQPASAFEPPALDHSDFASFPETASFSGRTTPFSTSSLDSTNMRYSIVSHVSFPRLMRSPAVIRIRRPRRAASTQGQVTTHRDHLPKVSV